ncbi:MAG: HEPN domain-containing protein [Bacteroidota bacterium]
MKNIHIAYRIKRAKETYEDALFLYKRESLNSCINRLYYAAFYATLALLINNNIQIKSHKGVKQKLGEIFVSNGIISREYAKVYSILSDYRHKGDYDDLFEVDKALIDHLLPIVKDYIQFIENLLIKKN